MAKQYKTLGDDIWKNKVEKIVSEPSLAYVHPYSQDQRKDRLGDARTGAFFSSGQAEPNIHYSAPTITYNCKPAKRHLGTMHASQKGQVATLCSGSS